MNRNQAGMTLVELLVVTLSLMVISAFGLQILSESGKAVSRGLSIAMRGDRLRHLQRLLDRDLSSRYGGPSRSPAEIGSATPEEGVRTLLRTEALIQGLEDQVELNEVVYTLEDYPEGSGRSALVRTTDPDPSPGKSARADSRPVFHLGAGEKLTWERATEGRAGGGSLTFLKLTLEDRRFKAWLSERSILLEGATP